MLTHINENSVHLDEHGHPRMITRQFVIPQGFDGYRLDHYLKIKIPRLSRRKIQHIIHEQVTHNQKTVKPHASIREGDIFLLQRPAKPEPNCPRHFTVLYEDEDLLAINKPSGLPVHSSAKFYFNTLTRLLFETYGRSVQIAHRIDRETSGCMLVAKNKHTAALLKQAFTQHRIDKTYLAIVHGTPSWSTQTTHCITHPLALTQNPQQLSIRMTVTPQGKPASTVVQVVAFYPNNTLIRCIPQTGRQHQIRVHLAQEGYPIVGDKLYIHGDGAFIRYCNEGLTNELLDLFILHRQALHASDIHLIHPTTQKKLHIHAPLPQDMQTYLDRTSSAINTIS